MKQLILATTALTVLSTAAFANGNAEHKSHHAKHHHKVVSEAAAPVASHGDDHFKSGFYLGANAGVAYHTNKLTSGLNNPGVFVVNNSFLKKSKNKFGAIGEILVGGRYKMERWLLGAEVSGNLDSNKASRTFNHRGASIVPIHVKVKKEYGIVPALVFGHQCNEKNALFMKLGLSINRYKLSAQEGRTGTNVKFSGHKTKLGFAPTIGMEHSFSRHLSAIASLGAEFNGSVKKRFGPDGVFIDGNRDFVSIKNKTNSYTAKVGVLWKL